MPDKPIADEQFKLEEQFIMRIPEEVAVSLRAAIQKGDTNLRDRLHIKLENDLRYGEVRFDDWMMYAKVVDLPTIIESLKTIDNKSFYKTADICHMMICKFEQDAPQPEEESPNKAKKKDPNKVDKKYLWPHGITPPCKNVRKRRFRKTLKKKYVEAPEIEREVKRLLRIDNDAVHVKYEIINEEEDDTKAGGSGMNQNGDKGTDRKDGGKGFGKNAQKNRESANSESNLNNSRDVGEHEIFGDVSSSDDDDEGDMYKTEMDDHSQMSADDSRMSGSNDFKVGGVSSRPSNFYRVDRQDSDNEGEFKFSGESIRTRISDLKQELTDLKSQRMLKEQEVSSIQNQTLRQRLQENLINLVTQINDKEMELIDLQKRI